MCRVRQHAILGGRTTPTDPSTNPDPAMTERKPDNVSWESWIERQIQDGQRDGAFEHLRGHGRPIDSLGTVHDDLWWVKSKLRDEDVNFLPPTIAIRADRADAIDAAMDAATEADVRTIIGEINARIRYVNSHATAGPPSTVVVIDTDVIVARWREAQPVDPESELDTEPRPASESVVPRRSWWMWWRRRRAKRRTRPPVT